eukprot:CAMPEP_0185778132 /NCGR_PEP_ID=MMETSP1174-20130828/91629_1 /TAXON_ID=35687 /ORGANISM="Dictyocha speculum, Strain CCMP1381" /LENGTH=36 /DNA_ID= /DNA_START= /DNA_END= /DNA_ORIENTATION=
MVSNTSDNTSAVNYREDKTAFPRFSDAHGTNPALET